MKAWLRFGWLAAVWATAGAAGALEVPLTVEEPIGAERKLEVK